MEKAYCLVSREKYTFFKVINSSSLTFYIVICDSFQINYNCYRNLGVETKTLSVAVHRESYMAEAEL